MQFTQYLLVSRCTFFLVFVPLLLSACDQAVDEVLTNVRPVESAVVSAPQEKNIADTKVRVTKAAGDRNNPQNAGTGEVYDNPPRVGLMVVPLSAVFADRQGGHRQFVWVINEKAGTVHQREVEVGRMQRLGAEILRGLKEGERIVTADVQQLNEGDKVELLVKKG